MESDHYYPAHFDRPYGSRRRGFSLVETAVVLGIMGLLIGAIWVVAATARSYMRRAALIQQTDVLVYKLRDYYSVRPIPQLSTDLMDSSTLSTWRANLRLARVFPDDMCGTDCVGNTVTRVVGPVAPATPYEGPVEIGIPNMPVPINAFYITYSSLQRPAYLPREACVALGMAFAARASSSGLRSIIIESGQPDRGEPYMTTLTPDLITPQVLLPLCKYSGLMAIGSCTWLDGGWVCSTAPAKKITLVFTLRGS